MSTALQPDTRVGSCVIKQRLAVSFNATTYTAEFYPEIAARRIRKEIQEIRDPAVQKLYRKRLKFICSIGREKIIVFLKQYNNPGYKETELIHNYVLYQQKIHSCINEYAALDIFCKEYDSFICDEPGKRAYYQAVEYFKVNQPLTALLNTKTLNILDSASAHKIDFFQEKIFYLKRLFYALSLLHEAQIVHADLKPDNLLIIPNESIEHKTTLRLIDFDASLIAGEPHPRYLQFMKDHPKETYRYRGTAGYVSPEHFNGEVPCFASDVFTASVIAFEMLSKDGHPFPFMHEEYRTAVRKGQYHFSEMKGKLSSTALDALVAGLSYDKTKRPSASDLLEAFKS